MPADYSSEAQLLCKVCQASFKARGGKVYCSKRCSRHALRPIQNSTTLTDEGFPSSPTKKRKNLEFFDTASLLGDRLYSLPPDRRLGYVQELIAEARGGNVFLREILSNYKLLHPNPVTDRWMFHRACPEYCTIAQAANRYCLKFWGAGVADVVYCRAPEPETGQVITLTSA